MSAAGPAAPCPHVRQIQALDLHRQITGARRKTSRAASTDRARNGLMQLCVRECGPASPYLDQLLRGGEPPAEPSRPPGLLARIARAIGLT